MSHPEASQGVAGVLSPKSIDEERDTDDWQESIVYVLRRILRVIEEQEYDEQNIYVVKQWLQNVTIQEPLYNISYQGVYFKRNKAKYVKRKTK